MPIMSYCKIEKHTKGERTPQHSRKRKADVAIFLQDPDENLEMELVDMTKKKQYQHKGNWSNQSSWQSPSKFIPTPEKEADAPDGAFYPQYTCLEFGSSALSPLPQLSWANNDDVWRNMMHKDVTYVRDKNFLHKHPELQQRQRSILLDWLMEVCEAYKLRRETFYLAQDFFDRFMATQENVLKNKLQLIGISSLFIAAKIEEIHPPKLHEFAYITDSACREDEILHMELIIMKALEWFLSPMTVVSWLNVYLQISYIKDLQHFLIPQYPQKIYLKIVALLDLCIMDIGCLEYPYGVLAASALYHFSSFELVETVTCYEWVELEACIKYMIPFALVVRDTGLLAKLKICKGVDTENLHNIQTHTCCFDLLEMAQAKKEMLDKKNRVTPVPNGVLTPPQSDKKQD